MLKVRDLIPWSRGREVALDRPMFDHPLATFQREFDRLFEDLWRGFDMPMLARSFGRGGVIAPRIDVRESDAAVVVAAELPGLTEGDIEVGFGDGVLTIKGEKKAEREESRGGVTYSERSFGSFERRIPVDTEVISEKAEAVFKDGVLTVTLPKNPAAQKEMTQIPVTTAKAEVTEQKAA